MSVRQATENAIAVLLKSNEPFTSACVSHPQIASDSSVRHVDVSRVVRSMWNDGELAEQNGTPWVRTSIKVHPSGFGNGSVDAWLYHPGSFDPDGFDHGDRVLVRSDSDDEPATVSLAGVRSQCHVQNVDTTLNIPTAIIKQLGWKVGDKIAVTVAGAAVLVKKDQSGSRVVDAEGRIRLRGSFVDALKSNAPIVLLITPATGDKYIQVADLDYFAEPSVNRSITADVADIASISVWGTPDRRCK